ncbi:MAG: hypothetical protein OXF64_06765 [bacterium]|nr:hypothetical protein [bacterium]MCY4194351.1 hypothetical protein [bacterium]MCY4273451.1 hypothetical protein [bacterium]
MSSVTVLSPVYEDAPPAEVAMAPRFAPTEPVVIGLIDNAKSNAKELLTYLAEGLRTRLPVADVVVHSKSAAGKPIDADDAEMLAARAHLVISGLGD